MLFYSHDVRSLTLWLETPLVFVALRGFAFMAKKPPTDKLYI